ncbi:MAG: UxaA family hydrolase [Caldilineaceae bacterium]|nr:UxaA family hydrolase [Caldilineaceae bacterium]
MIKRSQEPCTPRYFVTRIKTMPDVQSNLLLRISDQDNVYVLLSSVNAGTALQLGEKTVIVENALELGHKIAARNIAAGEKIVKYGAPIGSATRDIRAGEHVHLHNIKSNYIPTYTLNSETD